MSRPTRKANAQKTPDQFTIPAGFVGEGEIKFKPRENSEERRHRLRKESWEFWVKEAPTYVLSVLVLTLTAVWCFWVLWHPKTPREERQWVMSVLTSLVVGIIGYLFGRVTK